MNQRIRFALLLSSLSILCPLAAAAQDRPFAFVSSPAAWDRDGALVFFEPAFADSAPEAMARDGFGSRMGFEAKVARRVLLVGDVSFADSAAGTSRTTFTTEALVDLLPGAASGFHLAAGTGYRREETGTSVWIGRLVGERILTSTRLLGDLRFEKAYAPGRDNLDTIVTLAASRFLGKGFSLGAEVVGQDLEALWETDEAEGGARVLAGPSLHWVRPDHRLLATLAGGPVFRIHSNTQTSPAPRSLGNGYAVRASVGYVF
ncbi:MAG TPA: hypothetical protein VLV54_09080 [Thermoanaerobaculia bacterium]|nr:hypothetical protein [Thermoanaerobaculia bacterium]